MEELTKAEEFELRWVYAVGSTILYLHKDKESYLASEVHILSLLQKGYLILDKELSVPKTVYILTGKGKQYIENIPLLHFIRQILSIKDPFDLKLWEKTWGSSRVLNIKGFVGRLTYIVNIRGF